MIGKFLRRLAARVSRPVREYHPVPITDEEVLAAIRSVPLHHLASILKDCKITRVENAVAAGTTEQISDTVDMSGYDSVCFVQLLGDVDNTSVVTLTVKSNATDITTGGTTEKAGTATTATATSADNKLIVVDVLRPSQRYVFASLTRATANAVLDGLIAIQYGTKSLPVTQGTTVLTGDLGGPVN